MWTTVQPFYIQSFTRSEQQVRLSKQQYDEQPVMIYTMFTSWHDTDFWWKCTTNSQKVADNIIVSATWSWASEEDQWNQWWYIITEQKKPIHYTNLLCCMVCPSFQDVHNKFRQILVDMNNSINSRMGNRSGSSQWYTEIR